MFTDLSLHVTLGSVPSSQPLFTDCPYGLGNQGSLPISLYRSPIADTKFTDLSL